MVTLSILVLTACNEAPDTIDFGIEWAFDSPSPETLEEFVSQVREINKEITKDIGFFNIIRIRNWWNRSRLDTGIGFDRINLRYGFSIEQESGEWEEHQDTLRIIGSKGEITRGEIIFWLHHKTEGKLVGQDYYAVEEIYLVEPEDEDEVPTYEVFFGS